MYYFNILIYFLTFFILTFQHFFIFFYFSTFLICYFNIFMYHFNIFDVVPQYLLIVTSPFVRKWKKSVGA
jgi:hypothetical protein